LVTHHAVTGIHLIDDPTPPSCDSCLHAKLTRKIIHPSFTSPAPPAPQTTAFGDEIHAFGNEIHSDVWGPAVTQGLGGQRYYVTFTDDYTRYTYIKFLRTKDQTLQAYKAFVAWAHTQHHVSIKRLRSDRGGEFLSHDFTNFLYEQGTERRLTTANTPQHNGVAESLNRRLLEMARTMLHHAQLPTFLWVEAVRYAVWLKNRVPTKVLGHDMPYQRLYGHAPNFANLPQWGQVVWVHNPDNSKLDAHSTPERWVGYDTDSPHAYRIYWPHANKISVERNVKIIEVFADDEATSKSYSMYLSLLTSKQSLFHVHLNHQHKKN